MYIFFNFRAAYEGPSQPKRLKITSDEITPGVEFAYEGPSQPKRSKINEIIPGVEWSTAENENPTSPQLPETEDAMVERPAPNANNNVEESNDPILAEVIEGAKCKWFRKLQNSIDFYYVPTYKKLTFYSLICIFLFPEKPDRHVRMDIFSHNQLKLMTDYEGHMLFTVLPGHEAHRNDIIDVFDGLVKTPGWYHRCPVHAWEGQRGDKKEEEKHFIKVALKGDKPNDVIKAHGNIMYHKKKSIINFMLGATSSINGSRLKMFFIILILLV